MVATEASDFCKRSARVRPMSFVAYPRARVREAPVPRTEGFGKNLPFAPLGGFYGVRRSAFVREFLQHSARARGGFGDFD